ncbi:hypothetical protein U1Q18_039029, partial [Sarracenia purpurea var. burkii]
REGDRERADRFETAAVREHLQVVRALRGNSGADEPTDGNWVQKLFFNAQNRLCQRR